MQWTLAYQALKYPAARIIHPQYFRSHVVKNGYKKKHTCVPLKAKLDIINHVKKGESHSILASEYGIVKSTIGDFKKNEEKIRKFASMMENLDMSAKL